MSDLKSCPFCNGTHSINVINFFTRDSFRKCDICGAEAPEAKTPEEAAEKWNRRPAEDAKDKEIERLKAVIAEIGAMTLTGADDVEDFIFIICKDTVSDEAIKQAYRKHLKNNIAKMVFGKDTDVPANAPDTNVGKMEEK